MAKGNPRQTKLEKSKRSGDVRQYQTGQNTSGEELRDFVAPHGGYIHPEEAGIDLDIGLAMSGVPGDREAVNDVQQLAGNVLQGHNGFRFSTGRKDGRAPDFPGHKNLMQNVSTGVIREGGPRHAKIDKQHGAKALRANAGKAGEKSGARWRQ
jgi:hypothetical protein